MGFLKKNLIAPLALLLMLTFATSGCEKTLYSSINFPQANMSGGDLSGVKININNRNNKTLPKAANVYKVQKLEVTNSSVLELAQEFGLSGDVQLEQQDNPKRANMYSLSQGKESLDVYEASGGFFYMDLDNLWKGNPLNDVPTEEEAINTATEYLKLKGWLFDDSFAGKVTYAYESDFQGNKKVTDVAVKFGRAIDGIPVDGVGTPIKVFLGEGGKITGVTMLWRKFSLMGKVPLIDYAAAVEEVKENKRNNSFKVPLKTKEVTITDVELVYFDEGVASVQPQLKPAYKYTGSIKDDSNSILPFVGYIEAQQ